MFRSILKMGAVGLLFSTALYSAEKNENLLSPWPGEFFANPAHGRIESFAWWENAEMFSYGCRMDINLDVPDRHEEFSTLRISGQSESKGIFGIRVQWSSELEKGFTYRFFVAAGEVPDIITLNGNKVWSRNWSACSSGVINFDYSPANNEKAMISFIKEYLPNTKSLMTFPSYADVNNFRCLRVPYSGKLPEYPQYTIPSSSELAPLTGIIKKTQMKESNALSNCPENTAYISTLASKIEVFKKDLKTIRTGNGKTDGYWIKKISDKIDSLAALYKNNITNLEAQKGLVILSMLKDIITDIKARKIDSEGFITYEVNPMKDNVRILPDTINIPGEISDNVNVIGCPGEYEAASFAVKAFDNIKDLSIQTSDLEGKHGTINSTDIDVRIVKCWYVGGNSNSSTYYQFTKFLAPELLLKDDSLIKVDTEKKANYIKLVFNRGLPDEKTEYRCISDYPTTTKDIPRIDKEKGIYYYYWDPYRPDAFPVKDSKELLPVNIPADTNKQFWITVKIPDSVEPGIYKGKIKISSSDKNYASDLDLKLRVLPFRLSKLPCAQSIIYESALDLNGKGSIGTGHKSKSIEQYTSEMKNLVAHGITNPPLILSWWLKGHTFDKATVAKMLEIRRNAGMDMANIYLREIGIRIVKDPQQIKKVQIAAKELLDFIKSQGSGNEGVYFYGIDEGEGEALIAQRKLWEAIREIGGKTWVSGFPWAKNFEELGDIQDILIRGFQPSRAEAAKWHSKGHKIFCYGNPQTGIEFPETYRRNYGLLLWQNDYDAQCNNAYMSSYGCPWNDFDCMCNRNETMAYPTVDGVIDTIEWEGNREGIDDWRYIVTLQDAIEKAKKEGNSEELQSAQRFLENLKEEDLARRSLDVIRMEMIKHIIALKKGK